MLPERPEHGDPVGPREVQVDHRQVRRQRRRRLDGRRTGARFRHDLDVGKGVAGEPDDTEDHRVTAHDEDACAPG